MSRLRQSLPDVELQLMRADRVAEAEHLIFATRNALRAFSRKYQRSRTVAMEILLYVSCQRQISKAIELLGVTQSTSQVAIVALSRRTRTLASLPKTVEKILGGKLDDKVLEIRTKRKLLDLRKAYDISEKELGTVRVEGKEEAEVIKQLVLERSALLALES